MSFRTAGCWYRAVGRRYKPTASPTSTFSTTAGTRGRRRLGFPRPTPAGYGTVTLCPARCAAPRRRHQRHDRHEPAAAGMANERQHPARSDQRPSRASAHLPQDLRGPGRQDFPGRSREGDALPGHLRDGCVDPGARPHVRGPRRRHGGDVRRRQGAGGRGWPNRQGADQHGRDHRPQRALAVLAVHGIDEEPPTARERDAAARRHSAGDGRLEFGRPQRWRRRGPGG